MSECYELSQLSKPPSTKEGQEAWELKRMKAQAEINSRMIVLIHALFQVSGACRCKVSSCCMCIRYGNLVNSQSLSLHPAEVERCYQYIDVAGLGTHHPQ